MVISVLSGKPVFYIVCDQILTPFARYMFEYERFHEFDETVCRVIVIDREVVQSFLNFNILRRCQEIWDVVKETLCQDSPEGHQDQAEFPVDDELHSGEKDGLSYCWRALKESRSVVGFLSNNWIQA